ncbi:hypothetical protein Pla52o_32490 [Novipirellula galeiformis]|uniref:Uncharacterized protein n=1 Tax=Novipirellula galeiformis TaxID=2528004 RepID=A0A5C6CFA2_9BACT|nr:hypothetical protein [Novipirellula galeiformis]TWU22194.1 hypothetical protein Pla52o_32490 [Novipirellula galeiformis]
MKTFVRRGRIAIAGLLLCVSASTVSADWHQFWHNCNRDYYRNNAWPEPFQELDAMQVSAAFDTMKHNGWRLHNTIGNELFRDGDGALLASGHNRVFWIATQSPESRRNVYVLRGRTDAETDARVASVRQTLASVPNTGAQTNVFVTDREPSTAPGAWATQINRQWMLELPKPKLPSATAQGGPSVTQ